MKHFWTEKEKQLLMDYAYASDEETVTDQIDYARHMMYNEGNHPELKGRSLSACISMFYKKTKLNNQQS
ncbi:hypothetical protein E2605_18695 [Dysgonomonas capnocytophagoides]|uniref:Uncharacterized protein n=1 Tax=Dysgonomonas capnocytophagoides TaxID=45254 RepID=A0A4Y8L010_9BACT|nr:hypothetical protein [Dysgonomonas capnocytophagoides]TFD92589.1 hypothetical protein E2605_18695 [Dysgonomonas capnocytophagoides]